jgi:hypothetical protein
MAVDNSNTDDILTYLGKGENFSNPKIAELLTWKTYAGNPTNNVTPDFIRQFCHDTTNSKVYFSTGLTSANWTALN